MKKRFQIILSILSSVLMMFLLFPPISVSTSSAMIQSEDPTQMIYYNEPVFIQMDLSKLSDIEFPQDINQTKLLIYTQLFDTPEIIDMQKRDNIWEAVYTLTDTSVKMIMFTAQIEDSLNQESISFSDKMGFQDMLVYNETNTPVRGAHQARALSYTGLARASLVVFAGKKVLSSPSIWYALQIFNSSRPLSVSRCINATASMAPIVAAYDTATASNQPHRRGRPVVVPYSLPLSRMY